MKKKSERVNVLTEGNNKNLVHSIINAVTKGYSDNVIIDDVLDLVKSNEISQGILITCPETLRLYAENISKSLTNIADEVEGFKIQQQEMTVERKKRLEEQNENKHEDNDDFDFEESQDKTEKKSSSDKILITEDWEKSGYNEKENKLAGILLINLNQDISFYKRGDKISLAKTAIDYLNNKIFSYLKNEYPQLKAQLNENIFKGQIEFVDIRNGIGQLKYEIQEAFKK